MIQVYLGHKIILDAEMPDLANSKPIQMSVAVVFELFKAENNIAV